jgi:hypothetical protein
MVGLYWNEGNKMAWEQLCDDCMNPGSRGRFYMSSIKKEVPSFSRLSTRMVP